MIFLSGRLPSRPHLLLRSRTRFSLSTTVRSKDTVSNGAAAEHIETDERCGMLLPERVQTESSGTLAGNGASARGPGGKRKGRDLFAKAPHGQRRAKAERAKQAKKAKTIEESTELSVSKALSRILPGLTDRVTPRETNSRELAQEMEVRSAKLTLSIKMYEAHKEFSNEIEEIARGRKEGGGRRIEFREKYLEKILQNLEARMLKDADAEI